MISTELNYIKDWYDNMLLYLKSTSEPGDIIINYIYTNDNNLSKVCKYLDMLKGQLD